MTLRMGSLFSGIGGFELGFAMAGVDVDVRWQVEIDPWCRRVLAKHWPETTRYPDATKFARRIYDCESEDEWGEVRCPRCNSEFGDCECVGTDQLIDECGPVDIIVGGDPCQQHSNARRAGGKEPPSLGAEFIRIVGEIRPTLVLRENPAAVRADAAWPWWRFRDAIERMGYGCVPFRLRACCAGADIRRERLFLLAAISQPDGTRLEGDECEEMAGADGRRHDANSTGPDRWSATPRVSGRVDGIPHRSHRIKAIGNAVVPQVVAYIAGRMVEAGLIKQGATA